MDARNKTELVVMGGMLALSLAAPFAHAGSVTSCSGDVKAQQADIQSSAAGGYVLEAFKLNCSANVVLAYDGDATAVGVKSASKKGMHTFGGSSNGGSVKQCEPTSVNTANITLTASITTGC
ncbi:hypothetical protein [Chitinimonas sp. BJB300]|uniref:hypothetical protein n=1 Tax=Chitinimonas sp. BJB300 TaxID=1559339 RepID=UPI000C113ED7|nr:hypothetical protein [Chitinimonas sp. BJB300]PHV10380.1 hypothetical protein CSQ89_16560 [Chitinimonas sp. BJB300]TSJ87680.1 hypothetical protein FG002_012090 [Chitinimonas sp. BJB300]